MFSGSKRDFYSLDMLMYLNPKMISGTTKTSVLFPVCSRIFLQNDCIVECLERIGLPGNKKKRAIHRSSNLWGNLRLVYSDKPDPKSYEVLQTSQIHLHVRNSGKSIQQFITTWYRRSIWCEFGSAREEIFVVGANYKPVPKKPLSETSLSLSKAIEIVELMWSKFQFLMFLMSVTAKLKTLLTKRTVLRLGERLNVIDAMVHTLQSFRKYSLPRLSEERQLNRVCKFKNKTQSSNISPSIA